MNNHVKIKVQGGVVMSLGKQIQFFRKQKGLSQEQLAKRLYVSRQALSKWESDINVPSVDKIVDVAKELDVSINELLGLESDSNDEYAKLESILNQVVLTQNNEIKRNKTYLKTGFIVGLVSFVVIILALGVVFVKIRDLKNSNLNLAYQFNEVVASFENSLTNTIKEQLEKQDSILSAFKIDVENIDFEHKTMKTNIDLVAKDYQDNSKAEITLDYEHYEDQSYPLILKNGHFKLLQELPIDNILNATVTIGDDNKQSQLLTNVATYVLDELKVENYLSEEVYFQENAVKLTYRFERDFVDNDDPTGQTNLMKFIKDNKVVKANGTYRVNGKEKNLNVKVNQDGNIDFTIKNIKNNDELDIMLDYGDLTGHTYRIEKNFRVIIQPGLNTLVDRY